MMELVVINSEGKTPSAHLAAAKIEDGCAVSFMGYGRDILMCFRAIVRGLVLEAKVSPKLLAEEFVNMLEACEEEADG